MIVPVRNGAAVIGPCVESILQSRYGRERLQVIVVDNGSSDPTLDVLGDFQNDIEIVRENRVGPGAARNAGLRVAEGDIVAFTDADCVVDPGWVDALVTAHGVSGDVIGGRILSLPGANKIAQFGERIHDHRFAIEFCHPPYTITMNLAVTASALREVGGFDNRFLRGEDVDLSYRLRDLGCRFAYEPEAIIYHRNRDSLTALAREAWLHGLCASKIGRAYRERHEELWESVPPPMTEPVYAEYSTRLDPAHERLLWMWFRTFNKAGKLAGTFRSGALHDV